MNLNMKMPCSVHTLKAKLKRLSRSVELAQPNRGRAANR